MMKKPISKKEPIYKYSIAMLIDDNELDNFINQKIIESSFFAKQIYVCTNGFSALEFFKNIQANKSILNSLVPDIIFVDINMPFIDGFQFINEYLKQSKETKTKMVILTSSISPLDKELAESYGKNVTFINKPLNESILATI